MRLSGRQRSSLTNTSNNPMLPPWCSVKTETLKCLLVKFNGSHAEKAHGTGSENWSDIGILLSPCSHLSSLACLDLSNNNLSVVPKGLPRNLVLLHLEKNSIRSIPGDALTPVRNLEYLLLHNNKLRSRSIHPGAFQVHFFIHFISGFCWRETNLCEIWFRSCRWDRLEEIMCSSDWYFQCTIVDHLNPES